MLTCRWCGENYEDSFSIDHNENGFWCDVCEGFTFYHPADQNKHRLLLLLEQKESCPVQSCVEAPAIKLRKQLSPLRYPGGKSKLIDYLYSKLSSEKMETFVEVFAGGASLGLSLLDAGIIQRLILNDKDPCVYAFWNTVMERPQELVSRLYGGLPSHRDLASAKAILDTGGLSESELAWSFLLANRLSYSGIVKANPMGGKNGTQEALLARWNPEKLAEKILRIHSMRDRIVLYNMDACQFLTDYGYWHRNCTCFIDPPYYIQGAKLYSCFYTENDHRALAECIQTLYVEFPDADMILTYDDHPRIRELYPLARQEMVQRRYSLRN